MAYLLEELGSTGQLIVTEETSILSLHEPHNQEESTNAIGLVAQAIRVIEKFIAGQSVIEESTLIVSGLGKGEFALSVIQYLTNKQEFEEKPKKEGEGSFLERKVLRK